MVRPAGSPRPFSVERAAPAADPPRETSEGSAVGEAATGAAVGGAIGGRNLGVDVYEPPQGDTRLKVTDRTRGRVKNGKPVGEWIARVDRPHRGAPYPHVNVQKMPPALKTLEGLDHARIPEVPTGALRAAKHLGKPLIVVGLAADALDIGRARKADEARGDGERTETKKAIGRAVGSWGGAAAGAAAGAAVGSVVPGLGTAIGGLVGGLVGGIGGSFGGSAAGEWVGSRL
jgi:hypothetical protein